MNSSSSPSPDSRTRILVTCSMCGNGFDPAENSTCEACPLHRGCTLVRCPVCGFETVNPANSSLVRLARRVFSNRKSIRQAGERQPTMEQSASTPTTHPEEVRR